MSRAVSSALWLYSSVRLGRGTGLNGLTVCAFRRGGAVGHACYSEDMSKLVKTTVVMILALTAVGCASPAEEMAAPPGASLESQFTPREPDSIQPSVACNVALKVAAEVEELDNNDELFSSLSECETADDWIAALRENPGAGGTTSYSGAEAARYLWLVCGSFGSDALPCVDGVTKGYFQL